MANYKVNYITEGTIKEIDAGSLQFRLEPSRDFKREMCGKTAIIFAQEKPDFSWEADILSSVQDVSPESWFSFDANATNIPYLQKTQDLLKILSDLKNNGTTIRIRVKKSNLTASQSTSSPAEQPAEQPTVSSTVSSTGQSTDQSTDQPDIPKAITCDGLLER